MNVRENIRRILTENNRMSGIIRTIVKDIIFVFKQEDDGDYYLPEYFEERDEMVYEFDGLNPFNVEVKIENGNYEVDAEYYREDETILIKIKYDTNNKNEILYKLIGDLNEVVAHEVRHIKQQRKNMFDLNVEEPKSSLEYYTQPHEIDAQYFGFKRISRLREIPFEDVVRDWFETHKGTHRLKDNEIEIVVGKILNYKKWEKHIKVIMQKL